MKTLITIILSIILFFIVASSVYADPIAGSSAAIKINSYQVDSRSNDVQQIFKIKKSIQNVLKKYNSPLITEVDSFVDACITYQIDCYLLPSIAGLESTFGKFILPNSYNPFGWGGGNIIFDNWNEGVFTVAKGLRNNYLNKGAKTLGDIGYIYSESPTWTPRVQYFINSFQAEEEKIELFLSSNQVQ